MRTTLDIDEDVLQAAKALAAARKSTAGKILSELARKALEPTRKSVSRRRHGVPLLPPRQGERPVTMAMVSSLREEAP
jgi:hypothetical protein